MQVKAGKTGSRLGLVERKRFLWCLGCYGASFALVMLLFLHRANDYFVADDWAVIARNREVHLGWRRPLFGSFVALCWKLFGLNATGYHLASMSLYSLVAGTVGTLGALLTRDRRVGVLSTVLFVFLGCHAEPVLWFSSANELLAGLFAVCGMSCYVLFRRTRSHFWLLVSGMSHILAITAKETALSLPLVLLAYDTLVFFDFPSRPNLRQLVPLIPFVLATCIFVPFYVAREYHYSIAVTIPKLVKNLVYYLAIEVFALPSNYAYLASVQLWRESPVLPVVAVTLTTSVIAVISLLLVRFRFRRSKRDYARVFSFAIAVTIIALTPVVPMVSERTSFMSSIGVALTWSIAFVCIWDALGERSECKKGIKYAVIMAAILYSATNATVLIYRSSWWGKASKISEDVLMQLQNRVLELPADAEIGLVNLPDHLEYAFVFRNAFPAAAELLGYDCRVWTVLDNELALLSPSEKEAYISQLGSHPDTTVLWYEDGILVPKQQPTEGIGEQ